jgi:nucleoside-diphosphate-sugar epimerase
MQILITGANGFVGSALSMRALSEGLAVHGATRSKVILNSGIKPYVVGEINSQTNWSKALLGCTHVIHTAARVHVKVDSNEEELQEFRKVNVEGTLSLASQAIAAGVKRFVFISSIKVNGESTPKGHPFTDTDAPSPIDPYGISKMEAEIALKELASKSSMEVVIIRPPLVYGPGVKANFRAVIKLLKLGIPLPLGAIDSNRRSFVAIDNLVDLTLKCLTHPNAKNKVFLVSDGNDLSTTELLRHLSNFLNKRVFLIPIPVFVLALIFNVMGRKEMGEKLLNSLQVDIETTCRTLDWSPPLTVEEGLKKTIQGFL